MGTNLTGARSGHRRARRRATSAIAIVAVLSLATACTAASAGAAKQASSRYYWTAAGAAAAAGAAKPEPSRYWSAAGAAVRAQTWTETQQSLRLEHVGKNKLIVKVSDAAKAGNEYRTLRSERLPETK
jgi:hypothetical protein